MVTKAEGIQKRSRTTLWQYQYQWRCQWRWRWHVMSGLNVVLVCLGLKIAVQLVYIGMYLVLAGSVGHLVGWILERSNPKIPQKPSGEKEDAWLETKRHLGGVLVVVYVAWYTSSHLCA